MSLKLHGTRVDLIVLSRLQYGKLVKCKEYSSPKQENEVLVSVLSVFMTHRVFTSSDLIHVDS